MIAYIKSWLELKTDRRAVTALEYGVIAGVLVAAVAGAMTALGGDLTTKFAAVGAML